MKFRAPILINALTGGTRRGLAVNARLAEVAKRTGLPLAVGSQKVALDCPEVAPTFTIVRHVFPDGVIFANLSAASSVEDARRAVAMLRAQGLQLHLNAAQELAMAEGDRSFIWRDCIAAIAQNISVPVIAKEVGCGMTGSTAKQVHKLGVAAVDVGGFGGTNFVAIEHFRRNFTKSSLIDWGLPTPLSLLDVLGSNTNIDVCASGGIRSGLDIAKALALGAKMCGIAQPLLREVTFGGVQAGVDYIHHCLAELKTVMILTGARDISSLQQKPLIFDSEIWAYLQQRQLTKAWIRK